MNIKQREIDFVEEKINALNHDNVKIIMFYKLHCKEERQWEKVEIVLICLS